MQKRANNQQSGYSIAYYSISLTQSLCSDMPVEKETTRPFLFTFLSFCSSSIDHDRLNFPNTDKCSWFKRL